MTGEKSGHRRESMRSADGTRARRRYTRAMPDRVPSPAPRSDAVDAGGQEQEILRLREILVERDAELGTAKGRLTELETHPLQPALIARHLLARFPRLARFASAARRRLGGGRGQAG